MEQNVINRQFILVAGPSGSGKSRLARMSGLPVLRLDDFYRNDDDPEMPRIRGTIDWDHPDSWNLDAACNTIRQLLATGKADTPDYVIAENRAVGTKHLDLGTASAFLAEGIFAIETAQACRTRGLRPILLWLDRPGAVNFSRRLRRDLKQHRKPPAVLVRRGVALWQSERGLRKRALATGFEPLSMSEAYQRVLGLAQRPQ